MVSYLKELKQRIKDWFTNKKQMRLQKKRIKELRKRDPFIYK